MSKKWVFPFAGEVGLRSGLEVVVIVELIVLSAHFVVVVVYVVENELYYCLCLY